MSDLEHLSGFGNAHLTEAVQVDIEDWFERR